MTEQKEIALTLAAAAVRNPNFELTPGNAELLAAFYTMVLEQVARKTQLPEIQSGTIDTDYGTV